MAFFVGIGAFFKAFGFICGRPRNWPYAFVPVAIAALLVVLLATIGVWGANHVALALAGSHDGLWSSAGLWALRLILGVAFLAISLLVAFSLAQPLSGFALEELARRQELELGAPSYPPPSGTFFRTLRVTMAGLLVGGAAIASLTVVSLLLPPAAIVTEPLKFLVSALIVAWDLLDYAFGLRGKGVRERLRWMKENAGESIGLGCVCAAMLLVPGLGLLMLPVGVSAATRLVVRSDHSAGIARLPSSSSG